MKNAAFPLNAWYVMAWKEDVKRELGKRTICGKNIVFYRTASGDPVAMDDACWHRLAPLSMGKLDGDNVVCPYHGLKYEPGGRCVHMPSQDTINPSASVKSYPVVERYRFVWIWPGDPQYSDPDLIPDMHWLDDPEWVGDGGLIATKCNFQLVVDNLMDLTHEAFVHEGSIGDDSVAESPFEVSHEGRQAMVTRWMMDIDPPGFWAAQYKAEFKKSSKVDRWQIIHFDAPSTIQIDVGVATAGTGAVDGDRSRGIGGYVINTITPETDSTCHYFWAFVRNYAIHDQSVTNATRDGVRGVFAQDEVVLEHQQRAMEEHPDKEFYNLNIDAGAMWARKINDDLLAEENEIKKQSIAIA